MRENWLITGHCACFDDCPRWRSGCGDCPDLERVPRLPKDGTAFNWERKRRALQRSRLHVVAISDWLAARAKESPMLADKPVSRIYNGIDLDVFVPLASEQRLAARAALGIGANEIVVLLAGQTVQGLNGMRAPADAARIIESIPDEVSLRPLLVGAAAPALAKHLRRPALCLPFQRSPEEMARVFGLADVCLVTSEAEAFGRVPAESQACATPVVAFDTGALPEVVRDGVGGRVVARGDVAAAAAALSSLAGDAGARARMGEGGRSHVAAHFDSASVARQYEALFRAELARA
jgi:glycosyltransferase involved in cell wall biosynthesis